MGMAFDAIEVYRHSEDSFATTTAFAIRGSSHSGKNLWINGIGMTRLDTVTKIMSHLPVLLHPQPKNILVVCMGMGTALRSAWRHKSLQCDVVELVPDTYQCFKYFHDNAEQILRDPRVSPYVDDGRNFLLMSKKKYDVITMDPAPPLWSAGTVNLYAREFFKLCRDHLSSQGIMCLWIQPAAMTESLMIMKTFQSVFPATHVWGGFNYPGFYLLGFKNDSGPLDPSRPQNKEGVAAALADLNEWSHFSDIDALFSLHILNPRQFAAMVQDTAIITDDMPFTEFPLFRSLLDPNYKIYLTAPIVRRWRDAAVNN